MLVSLARLGIQRSYRPLIALALAITAIPSAAQTVRQVQPQWQLWKINADGTGLAQFADTPGYSCGSPKWSPDGTMVAYDTRRIEEGLLASQVAVIRADGTQPPRLLGPGSMPGFSPDGTHLVFHTYNPPAIVVMNADGSGRETIIHHFGSPRWMPGGDRIASIGQNGGIALFDLATGKERNILSGPYSLRPGFGVSPDGLRFAFGDNDGGGLYLATLDRRMMRTTIRTLWDFGHCYHASWSPDGKRIVFGWKHDPPAMLLRELSLHRLYVLDVDSNGPPTLLEGQDTRRNNTNPDWSPDGKTIIFASQEPLQPQSGTPP